MESNLGLLPAEVLLKIFSYCSYVERVKFQFVCRWWQQVSRDKHLWREIVYKPGWLDDTQDIIDNLTASPELRALDLRDVKFGNVTKELVAVMKKRCPQLEQLSVSWNCLYNKFHLRMYKIKTLILEGYNFVDFHYLYYYFPNVKHLDCRSAIMRASELQKYLRKKKRSLQKLGISCEVWHYYCTLPYLSVCKNLRSLTLHHPCRQAGCLPGRSVKHLKQILSLTLIEPTFASVNEYWPMFRYFSNLVELELHKCNVRSDMALLVVAENCPVLEKLTHCSPSCLFRDQNLKNLSYFTKLTSLCLIRNTYITDACVVHLKGILELRYLEIFDCEQVTPKCILDLCRFDKLQTLKFDLQYRDLPADLGATPVKNPDLHIMLYRCKDASVLDQLRCQQFRVTLLKWFRYGQKCCTESEEDYKGKLLQL